MGKKKKVLSVQQRVLNVFDQHPTQMFTYKQVAARLGVSDASGRNHIIKSLKKLVELKSIEEQSRGSYKGKPRKKYHEGVLDLSGKGVGYIISEDFDEDVMVASNQFNKAFSGDTVQFYVYPARGKKRREAKIVDVISRKRTRFVGTLQKKNGTLFVRVSAKISTVDFFIDGQPKIPTEDGDRVLISFTNWKETKSPQAKIEEVLGEAGEADTEMHTILAEYGLPYKFDSHIEAEANKIDIHLDKAEITRRMDYRNVLTFTIDPTDAKDFDDALSFKPLEEGLFEVGIHIADVSYYVQPGTLLDDEAYQRATSVYLVDRVLPMLPEQLSNKVCSLRPNEEKFTFSAIFTLDAFGNVRDQKFGRTVINSNYRFAYHEAQHIIETEQGEIPAGMSLSNKAYTADTSVVDAILQLNKTAKLLRKKRMQSGAISFYKEEVKFKLDEQKQPIEVFVKKSKDANKLIEEYMLLANKKVSEFIAKQDPKKTFVFRVHDEPDEAKLDQLKRVIGSFGYSLNLASAETTAHSINKLLKDIRNTREQNLIDTLTIRSMSKASYTTQNIGHYGLAFDYYTHFTSPIRRYPDVVAHRLLQHYLNNNTSPKQETYESMMKHCSSMEILATKAERDSIKFMQVKYMEERIGEIFTGVISGVVERGIYVELEGNKCEGMARPQDFPGDYYVYNEMNYSFVGEKTKRIYQLGDRVSVRVDAADSIKRHLDFVLLGHAE
ncbi:MAG: ribonuclease R [Bacteroidetes bacterium]|nr:ribonuclease R [Bacteroidota bacterium]MDA0888877.1 ribonuclease R [Bacteroidota bacterium]